MSEMRNVLTRGDLSTVSAAAGIAGLHVGDPATAGGVTNDGDVIRRGAAANIDLDGRRAGNRYDRFAVASQTTLIIVPSEFAKSVDIKGNSASNSLQRPVGSGFGAVTTADDVIAGRTLHGRTAIVTGGYCGLGLETTRVLRNAGARVIVPARDLAKARSNIAESDGVELETLDLMDSDSINAFADKFLKTGRPLDLLINNAGIMASPLMRDSRGHEAQFSTNHLGHFQLTTRLWPALVKSGAARIVTLTSRAHFFSPVMFDDANFIGRDYDPWKAYGQSKTANILFSVEANARGASDGVSAFAVNPGAVVDTDLKRYIGVEFLQAAGSVDANGKAVLDPSKNRKSIPQGAATIIWCATSPQLVGRGGVYCENCDIAEPVPHELVSQTMGGLSLPTGVMPYAIDRGEARRLWKISERLTS